MLKEHLDKTKAYLDINLTMAETNLVKTKIDYLVLVLMTCCFMLKTLILVL